MKTWGDIFFAALRRGDDHGYAAYLADRYMERKANDKLPNRKRGRPRGTGKEGKEGDREVTQE